jgi:hypothetical protein
VFEIESFKMVLLLEYWKFSEAIGACLEISKLWVILQLERRQRIMVDQQSLQAGE